MNCSSLRDSLAAYFASGSRVIPVGETCLLTLPIPTVDGRFVDITVEPTVGDYVIVSDGGKTTSELYSQGIHLTDGRVRDFEGMATRLGLSFKDGTFSAACRPGDVQEKVLALAACAAVAMTDVVRHHPVAAEEPLVDRVNRSMVRWQPDYIQSIGTRVVVEGHRSKHRFDFVSHRARTGVSTVGVKLLSASPNSRWQANAYGFFALDLEGTDAGGWPRLVIAARAEKWKPRDIRLVRSLSSRILEVRGGEESMIERELPAVMTELSNAA